VLIFVAPEIVRAFLPQYLPSIEILRVLAIALVVRSLNSSMTAIIQAHGHFTYITAVAFFNLVFIWGLLLVCVPRFGVIGAAIALLIGEGANSLIQTVIFVRINHRSHRERCDGNDRVHW
jgi:O-antigen/teichoic acid export membrane protein